MFTMFFRRYSTALKWKRIPPSDLRFGHIIKKNAVKMPQTNEILKEYGYLNINAGKLFKITESNMSHSMDYGGAEYYTGSMIGQELDNNFKIKINGSTESFPSGDFPLCVTEVWINGDDILTSYGVTYYLILDE